MKKLSLFLFAIALISTFLLVTAYSQEDMEVIDNSTFIKPQRISSVFKHEEHNEKAEIEECNECHHIYENSVKSEDETSEDQKCSDCHSLNSSGDEPALMKAYHLNCKGCHLEKKKGPIMCGECHKKS